MTMEKKKVAQLEFVADKLLPKLKKCLDKKSGVSGLANPAIEMATGLMLATDRYVFAAHKLNSYCYAAVDGEEKDLPSDVIMPVGILDMKGRVFVEIYRDCGDIITIATDEQGNTCSLTNRNKFPSWRPIWPSATEPSVAIDAKALAKAVKTVAAKDKTHGAMPCVKIAGNEGSTTLTLASYPVQNAELEPDRTANVSVGKIPIDLWAWFSAKRLLALLALEPKEMRYVGNCRGNLFVSDDTLMLLMPYRLEEQECKTNLSVRFHLDEWINGKHEEMKPQPMPKSMPQPKAQPKAEPTLAEILTAALAKLKAQRAA